ncbi:MAG: hypothetical protein NVS3B24_01710 [Candidatus Dormibacteria bacterium]
MVSVRNIVPRSEGEVLEFMPGEVFTWKTTAEQNGGGIDFGELTIAAGSAVPQHIHHANDETYYVLEGIFRFKVGDELAEAGPGATIHIPRGVSHAWKNTGNVPGRVTITFAPGGMTGYFRELAPLLPELMANMADMSKVQPDTMRRASEIMQRYGYEMTGPPLD